MEVSGFRLVKTDDSTSSASANDAVAASSDGGNGPGS